MARKVIFGRQLAIVVLLFLCAGTVNILLLHVVVQYLAPVPSNELSLQLQTIKRMSEEQSNKAIVFPSFSGDKSVSALLMALNELNYHIHFCSRDLIQCLASTSRKQRKDLIWLKQEEGIRPNEILETGSPVNLLHESWHIWSRRSLCTATQQIFAKQSSRQKRIAAFSDAWHPPCLPLPTSPHELAALIGDNPNSIWILHKARSSDEIVSSGMAVDPRSTGVLERYIASPLTVDGCKVTLLVYVAVTSLRPTRFYIYEDAEVHRAKQPYSDDQADLANADIHRTRHPQVTQPLLRAACCW